MKKKMLAMMVAVVVIVSAIGVALYFVNSSEDSMGVTLAYSEKVNYETLIIANEQGFFEEMGLNITTKLVTGGILAAEALITGSVDLAAMGDTPAVQLISKDEGFKIVARLLGSEGMHRIIAWNDIVEPKDLEGMRLGVQQSSSSHGAFLLWCETNEVNADNITFVYMNPMDIATAMSTREIDAMVGSEPWAVNTENLCGENVHELGNSSALGSTFPIVLMASEKVLREKPQAVTAVLAALDRANTFILDNWEEAMEVCASRTGLSLEDQDRCSGLQFYQLGFDDSDLQSLNMTAEILFSFGKISAMPDIMDNVDLRFLPE